MKISKRLIILLVAVVAIGGGIAWFILSRPKLPAGFAAGNGRLEANEVYIAAKYPGRIAEVLFNEGDMVEAGQVVARMDTTPLEAELAQAEAQIAEAQRGRDVALADVGVKRAGYDYANKQYVRSR